MMSDAQTELAQLKTFAERLATYVARLLEVGTRCPNWDSNQAAWRHDTKADDVVLFLLLKLAGSASAANAMLTLTGLGFWFESAVLARTIYDANLSIAFMLPTPDMEPNDWPSHKQQERLQAFFEETWKDPKRPFEEPRRRSQIPIKDLKAALGRFQSKTEEMNPYDAGQVALQMMRFLSDYTHMAYPRLMEFLEGGHGYRLSGRQPTAAFGLSGAAGALLYSVQTADSVALLLSKQLTVCSQHAKLSASAFISERLAEKARTVSGLQTSLSELSSAVEDIAIGEGASPGEVLRRFKEK
jgi:hypothetical protein